MTGIFVGGNFHIKSTIFISDKIRKNTELSEKSVFTENGHRAKFNCGPDLRPRKSKLIITHDLLDTFCAKALLKRSSNIYDFLCLMTTLNFLLTGDAAVKKSTILGNKLPITAWLTTENDFCFLYISRILNSANICSTICLKI